MFPSLTYVIFCDNKDLENEINGEKNIYIRNNYFKYKFYIDKGTSKQYSAICCALWQYS